MAKEFYSINRPDGRPEAYAVPPVEIGMGYRCVLCTHEDGVSPLYNHKEAFMCSPADSVDGMPHFVCHKHLPDNIVIFDPLSNMCRDKSGQNTWREAEVAGDAIVKSLFDGQDIPAGIMWELEKKNG